MEKGGSGPLYLLLRLHRGATEVRIDGRQAAGRRVSPGGGLASSKTQRGQWKQACVHAKDWVRLGVWAADKGLEEEARQAFEKALELDPDFADAHERLGRIQVDGEWLDAETVLQTELP